MASLEENMSLNELQIVLNNLFLYDIDNFDIEFKDLNKNKYYISIKLRDSYVKIDMSNASSRFLDREKQRNILIISGILKLPFVNEIKKAIKFEDIESFRPVVLACDTNIFYLRLISQHILRTPPLNQYDPTKLLIFYSQYVGDEIQTKIDNLKSKLLRSKISERSPIWITMNKAIIAAIELNELIHKKRIQRFTFEIDDTLAKEISTRRGESKSDVYDNLIVESYKGLMNYQQYSVIFLTTDQNCANAAYLAGLNTIFINCNDVFFHESFKATYYELLQFLYALTYTVSELKISLMSINCTLKLNVARAAVTLREPKLRVKLSSDKYGHIVKSVKKDLKTYRELVEVLE